MSPLEHHQKRRNTGITSTSEVILDLLRIYKFLPVMEVLRISVEEKIGSSSTIHRELIWLIEHGFIQVSNREDDVRIKECEITKKSLNHLEEVCGK